MHFYRLYCQNVGGWGDIDGCMYKRQGTTNVGQALAKSFDFLACLLVDAKRDMCGSASPYFYIVHREMGNGNILWGESEANNHGSDFKKKVLEVECWLWSCRRNSEFRVLRSN